MSDFNSNDGQTTDVVVEQLKKIADSGNVDPNMTSKKPDSIQWNELKNALTSRLDKIIENYKERQETKESQFDEPNVEKFNLEVSRDELLDLIASFTEPPFTIQRVCELLYSPFKYYDRISTFLRGLEKNLRVISSNDWPKCPAPAIINHADPSVEQSTNSCKQSNNSSEDHSAFCNRTMAWIREGLLNSDLIPSDEDFLPDYPIPDSSPTPLSELTTDQPIEETPEQLTPPLAQQQQQPSSPPSAPIEPESVGDG